MSKTLEELLKINLRRLKLNVKIEEEKQFVFPEGTAITKTIINIESTLHQRALSKKTADGSNAKNGDLSDLL